MPNFNLIDYYKAVNGTSTLVSGEWYINYDKSHAFKIYSDLDIIECLKLLLSFHVILPL